MSINRVIVVLPVLAGLVLTGTAVARMMPVQTVRDSVYQNSNSTGQQTCAHNGVHFNKQGHANCGLHKGWSDQGSTQGSEPGDQGGQTQGAGDAGTRHGAPTTGHGRGHEHHTQAAHTHGSHGHTHGTAVHGHSGSSHGKGHTKH